MRREWLDVLQSYLSSAAIPFLADCATSNRKWGPDAAVAEWLRKGLAPTPEERFSDATEMRDAWRIAAGKALADEERAPWWKRWLTSDVAVMPGED